MRSRLPLFRAAGFIEGKFFPKAVWKLMTQTGVRRSAQDGSGRVPPFGGAGWVGVGGESPADARPRPAAGRFEDSASIPTPAVVTMEKAAMPRRHLRLRPAINWALNDGVNFILTAGLWVQANEPGAIISSSIMVTALWAGVPRWPPPKECHALRGCRDRTGRGHRLSDRKASVPRSPKCATISKSLYCRPGLRR